MKKTYAILGMVSGLVLALLTGAAATDSFASVGAPHAGESTGPANISDDNYRVARRGRRGRDHDESHDDDHHRDDHHKRHNDSHREHEPGHHMRGQPDNSGSSPSKPSTNSNVPTRPGSSFQPMLRIEVPPSANQIKQPGQATPPKAGPAPQQPATATQPQQPDKQPASGAQPQQPDKQPATATQPQPRDEAAPQQANPAPQPPAEAKDLSTTK